MINNFVSQDTVISQDLPQLQMMQGSNSDMNMILSSGGMDQLVLIPVPVYQTSSNMDPTIQIPSLQQHGVN